MAGNKVVNDVETMKGMDNDDFWWVVKNHPLFVSAFNRTPEFIKRFYYRMAQAIQDKFPRATKRGGDFASNVGKGVVLITGSTDDWEEMLRSLREDVRLDEESAASPSEDEQGKEHRTVSRTKAPSIPDGDYSEPDDFYNESDPLVFAAYLGRRLERNLRYILEYENAYPKPTLFNMLNEACECGCIKRPIFHDLDNFRKFRNSVIHDMGSVMTPINKISWVNSVFSLEGWIIDRTFTIPA